MFEDLDAQLGGGRIQGFGTWTLSPSGGRIDDLDTRLTAFDLDAIRPWLPDVDSVGLGWTRAIVTGRLRGDGPLSSARWDADLSASLPDVEAPLELQAQGTAGLGSPLRFSDFEVRATSVPSAWLHRTLPASQGLRAPVAGEVRLNGVLADGLSVEGIVRTSDAGPASSVAFEATVSKAVDGTVPMSGTLRPAPLQLTHVAGYAPAADLQGSISGVVPFAGTARSLALAPDLQTSGGPLQLQVTTNLTDLASQVRVQGTLEDFEASALSGRLPEPTRLRGQIDSDLHLGSDARGTVDLALTSSRVGAVDIFRVVARAEAGGGVLVVDSIDARSSAGDVTGEGTLALVDSVAPGTIRLAITTPSLGGLRPLWMGESVIAADTLSAMELEFLLLDGLDPDTLRTSDEVQLTGRADGALTVSGHWGDWSARGQVNLAEAVYGRLRTDSARVELTTFDWPERSFELSASLDSTWLWDRSFGEAEADLTYGGGQGNLSVGLIRSPAEDVRVRAGFEVGDSASVVNLDQATIRLVGERWNLGGPSRVAWGVDGLNVQNFRLVRPEARRPSSYRRRPNSPNEGAWGPTG